MRITIGDLRAFIRFAELPRGQHVHESTMRLGARRRAERLIERELLVKGHSVDPDSPGIIYYFDRLKLPRKSVRAVEAIIKRKGLLYESMAESPASHLVAFHSTKRVLERSATERKRVLLLG